MGQLSHLAKRLSISKLELGIYERLYPGFFCSPVGSQLLLTSASLRGFRYAIGDCGGIREGEMTRVLLIHPWNPELFPPPAIGCLRSITAGKPVDRCEVLLFGLRGMARGSRGFRGCQCPLILCPSFAHADPVAPPPISEGLADRGWPSPFRLASTDAGYRI